jgi:hypothetical protein
MKKLALKILNSLMKTKDPFLFSTVLFCLMLLAYICGWNHITPMSAINGAIKMWTEEEITVIKAAE